MLIKTFSDYTLPKHPRQIDVGIYPELSATRDEWMRYEALLQSTSVCIFTVDNQKHPTVAGTGFMLEVDGRHFLITAAHVIKEPRDEGRRLYLQGVGIGPEYELRNEMAGSPGDQSDHTDSAFFELTDSQVHDMVASGRRPVPFEETDPYTDISIHTIGAVFPFPENKAQTRVSLTMIFAECIRVSGECSVDPKLLLHFGLENSMWNFVIPSRLMVDIDTGLPIRHQFFAGYSGAPVWSVPTTQEWISGIRPKIIGIVTTRSKKIPLPILVTKIEPILGALRDYFGFEYGRKRGR